MSSEMSQFMEEIIEHDNAGNHLKMTQVAEKAVQTYPRIPEMHYVLGCGYMQLGEYRLAADSFQNAILKKPAFAKAHYCRTECLLLLGEFDSAFSEWTLLSSINRALSVNLQQYIFKFLMS